jgi:hypothetical protein
MSKPYHKLEDAARRAYVLLYKIGKGDHKALQNAEDCADELKTALKLVGDEHIERFAVEVGDEE